MGGAALRLLPVSVAGRRFFDAAWSANPFQGENEPSPNLEGEQVTLRLTEALKGKLTGMDTPSRGYFDA